MKTTARVIFCAGPESPVSNVEYLAEIEPCSGYNGMCVYATTIEPVHFPENPKGVLCFDEDNNFLRYESAPAYSKKYEGWVKQIYSDVFNKWVTPEEYSEYLIYIRLKNKYEKYECTD